MARTPSVDGGRPVVVTVRLSVREAQALDRARGRLARSAYIRMILMGGTYRA